MSRVGSAGNSTIIIDFELCLTRNVDSDGNGNGDGNSDGDGDGNSDVGAAIALSRLPGIFFGLSCCDCIEIYLQQRSNI